MLTILLIAGLAFVGTGIYRVYKKQPLVPQYFSALARVKYDDRQMLEAGKAGEEEIIKALKRQSFQDPAGVKNLIQEYMSHTSVKVRAAAIEAAGGLDGHPFSNEIDKALKGDVPELRIAAVQALVRGPKENTLRDLRSARTRRGIIEAEKFAILRAIYRLSGDESERSAVATEVAADPPREPEIRQETYVELFRQQQRHPGVLKLAEAEIMNPAGSESALHALIYLSVQGKDWLRENLTRVPVREQIDYQTALAQFLSNNCVKDHAQIVAALKSKNSGLSISSRCAK